MNEHPIRLVVTDDLRRSRLTVFFRWLLVIPHYIWLYLWSVAAIVALVVSWLTTLALGRTPSGLHSFIAAYLVYSTRVGAHVGLLADPYPPFNAGGSYPIDLEIDPPAAQRRLATFFRPLLAIPALIFAGVLGMVGQVIAFLGWFVCIAIGRIPKGMRDLGAYCMRFSAQTNAYVYLLTDRYPTLASP
jgi:hypothetical protein